MRLAVIQDFLRSGGTENQSLNIVKAWQDLGHSAFLVTFRPGGDLSPRGVDYGLNQVALQRRDSRLSFWAPRLERSLVDLDIEGVLLMGRNANRFGSRLKFRFPQMPVIATCRTGRPLTYSYRRSLLAADTVVVNSHWAEERVLQVGVPRENIHCIRNALSLSWETGERSLLRQKIRAELKIPEGTKVMVKVASFIPGKNHKDLLEAVAGLDEADAPWELWLIGRGKTLRPAKQLARQLNIQKRVRFFGFQSAVKPYLAAADLMVSTSLEESLPNALIEGQSAGLPVVAYDTAGVKETFLPDRSGLLTLAEDINRFHQSIKQLLADDERLAEMGKQAVAFARTFPEYLEQGRAYLRLMKDG